MKEQQYAISLKVGKTSHTLLHILDTMEELDARAAFCENSIVSSWLSRGARGARPVIIKWAMVLS